MRDGGYNGNKFVDGFVDRLNDGDADSPGVVFVLTVIWITKVKVKLTLETM